MSTRSAFNPPKPRRKAVAASLLDTGFAGRTAAELATAYDEARAASRGQEIACPACGAVQRKRTYNQIFCSADGMTTSCKDRYWNHVRPAVRERAGAADHVYAELVTSLFEALRGQPTKAEDPSARMSAAVRLAQALLRRYPELKLR